MYCQQSDIETAFGASNVAIWSNKENTDTDPDTDAIAAAIEWATAVIADRFRGGPYVLPFVWTAGTQSPILTRWCATLAAEHLYSNRGIDDDDEMGGRLVNLTERVQQEITEYLAGQRVFAATRVDDGGAGLGPVVV